MKTLLVYSPFCTPATPPYAIANIYSFLKENNVDVKVLDLNLEFHKLKFAEEFEYYKNFNIRNYEEKTAVFMKKTSKTYSENNKLILEENKPELFDELFNKILSHKPKLVAFSVVYSSQAFYTKILIEKLVSEGIKCVVGGPAVNEILKKDATYCSNEFDLLEIINPKINPKHAKIHKFIDFSNFGEYFTKEKVLPIKTSTTCYYKQCAFCTHHQASCYYEFPLSFIEKTIEKNDSKYYFFIDDMIHEKRLLELAKIFVDKNIKWTCQLRPTKFSKETLQILFDSGLKMIIWGVESGNDRILKLMRKGTNKKEIKQILKDSHNVGIKNVVYTMFGFPTETKDEAIETINFLEENSEFIDLVSTSIFGLQKGTIIYERPDLFGVTKIIEKKRTILEPQITYEVSVGMTNEEAVKLRQNYKKTIEKINKYPKTMNFFREHMLTIDK